MFYFFDVFSYSNNFRCDFWASKYLSQVLDLEEICHQAIQSSSPEESEPIGDIVSNEFSKALIEKRNSDFSISKFQSKTFQGVPSKVENNGLELKIYLGDSGLPREYESIK